MKRIKYVWAIFTVLLMFFFSTNTIAVSQIKTTLCIDYPKTSNINADTMEVNGWVMSTYKDKSVKIYIDGKERQEEIVTRARGDVLEATKALGVGTIKENPEPGFKSILNLKDLKDGTHILKIEIKKDTGEILETYTKQLNLKKYNTTLCIDYPKTSNINADTMEVNGWVMSTCKDKSVKIYIDGKERQEEIVTRARGDVLEATKKLGVGTIKENPEPGFKSILNLKDLKDGIHTLKINFVTSMGEILGTYTKQLNLKKYPSTFWIDYPETNNINADTMEVNGWIMSTCEDKSIKIYIDGKERQEEIVTRERGDVLEATKKLGVGTIKENSKPGFKSILNLKDLKDGTHTLKINFITNEGEILGTYTKQLNLKKYNTTLCIDYPNKDQIRQDTMEVNGWVMSTCKDKSIKIYIDGKQRQEDMPTRARGDVLEATKKLGVGTIKENPEPGFKSILDLKELEDGVHTLKIDIISDTGEILATYSRRITLVKYPTLMYMDKPIDNFVTGRKTIEVSGWIMSGYENAVLKIELSGNEAKEISRRARPDVIRAITDYGTAAKNPTPGFSAIFDITNLLEGKHTIKITASKKDGTVLSTITKTFEINRKILRGIDVSEHQGKIDWSKVKNEVDFAIIRCGYGEDDPKQDDKRYFENISECEKYGIPYGVYIYSYAIDLEHARSEVNHVIRLLRGKQPTYGIWFDMEDTDGYKAKRNVSDQMCRDITYEFCSIMKSRGYNVGIYANIYWFTDILNDTRLDTFNKWVAQWSSKCSYKKDYVMWQYSSNGKIDGIQTDVDMDYYYR